MQIRSYRNLFPIIFVLVLSGCGSGDPEKIVPETAVNADGTCTGPYLERRKKIDDQWSALFTAGMNRDDAAALVAAKGMDKACLEYFEYYPVEESCTVKKDDSEETLNVTDKKGSCDMIHDGLKKAGKA